VQRMKRMGDAEYFVFYIPWTFALFCRFT